MGGTATPGYYTVGYGNSTSLGNELAVKVMKFNLDGTFDTSFENLGLYLIGENPNYQLDEYHQAISVLNNGRCVVALTRDFGIDEGVEYIFDQDGDFYDSAVYNIGQGESESFRARMTLPTCDGSGYYVAFEIDSAEIHIVRYDNVGTVDPTFGVAGTVSFPPGRRLGTELVLRNANLTFGIVSMGSGIQQLTCANLT